ncbi:pain [Drosophila busckii]|uniref:Pain n=1 Tax=Drosophila busckii TaxID=30019 RepID=A0A0M4EUM6_DROBS|nr:transient receptor potential cation channel protein painless [Drosophila busckii]ALC41437.1 pain [Drosophila busckii]
MDLGGCGFLDPQAQLGAALAKRDLREFQTALDAGAQPTLPDEQQLCIYEKALATPGCGEFIRACLSRGCNVNHINHKHNKAAISYAADSRDASNLAALLSQPNVQVDRKYGQLTALNSLANNLTADNAGQVRECMRLLLAYGASPNAVDQREMTPLHHVLKNNKISDAKLELVQLFLAQPQLDIDSYRNGQVRQLLQAQYPELQLPAQRESSGEIDAERLLRYLRDGDESQFEQLLAEHQLNNSNKDNLRNVMQEQYQPLLHESIKLGKHRAFDALLNTGLNINSCASGAATPVELAVIWGNWHALQQLLQHPELKLAARCSLLHAVISRLEEPPLDHYCDHQRCFELLLASEHVDINAQDASGQVPLYYAVKYRNEQAVQTLLRHGAYIGGVSSFKELPIQHMTPELLEQHFDACITTNAQKPGVQDFEIIINYMNLMRREHAEQQSPRKASPKQQLLDEMTPIAYIAESKELRHLLQHPLISSFLFLKWHRLSVIFYLNFLFYTFFTVSIITHTLLKFHESEYKALTALFGLCSLIGIIYLILREALQLIMSSWRYFRSVTNIMELALIVLSILTVIESSYDKETQRVLAVFTILLVSVEFCLLVGSLPVQSISTHMLMLRSVCSSFIKCFGLYSIFVVTFTLCFYILFGKPQEQVPGSNPGKEQKSEDGRFNTFSVPIEALIKTIVMLTGEFDAGDIKFDSYFTYFIFLLFVFFMTIVLFNLLNGLAVSDTQAIKAQAELNGAICRTYTLLRYEQVLTGRAGRIGLIVNSEPFRTICQRLLNIYPNCLPVRQISILPNDGNKVLIPFTDVYELKELGNDAGKSKASFKPLATNAAAEQQKKLLDPPLKFMSCCCSYFAGKCSTIDSRTVKLALALIDQKCCAEARRKREQFTERRLQQIEEKLDALLQLYQKQN